LLAAQAELVEQVLGLLDGETVGGRRQIDARGADKGEALPPLAPGGVRPVREALGNGAPGRCGGAPSVVHLAQLCGQPRSPATVDEVAHGAQDSGVAAISVIRAAHTSRASSIRVWGRSKSTPWRAE